MPGAGQTTKTNVTNSSFGNMKLIPNAIDALQIDIEVP
jgi:hypothetical protein